MNPNATAILLPSKRTIIVDYFKGLSSVYFLSHFHMDHVIGLKEIQHQCKIYCSDITRQLLLANQEFRAAHPALAAFPVNSRQPVPELPGLSVTLVPAGHCLGSVMFLFREEAAAAAAGFGDVRAEPYTVLHTGDFRIPTGREALSRVEAFHRPDGRIVPIDYAVVDTTFFTEHCRRLPTREESLREICCLVGDCIRREDDGGHQKQQQPQQQQSRSWRPHSRAGVVLQAKARFSYEYVHQGLAEAFHTKVHISEQALGYYGQLAGSLDFYTTRTDDCFVHLEGCGCDTSRMLNICLSTMYFDKMAGFSQPVVWPSERTVRVLFSFHPSMSEVADLLAYLRPRAARALVTPSEDTAEAVQTRLDALLVGPRGFMKRSRDDNGGFGLDFSPDLAVSGGGGVCGDGTNCDSDSDDSLCAVPTGACDKLARMSTAGARGFPA